ncbi:Ankyrin repeat and SOCS box protein 3 [Amphibalanus amphitrite]|uniref:Ankyrin repeat and SOCS box protein 3 n=1 Tax=Amphibalanus amphitrite TaxID=1232801 RepID=A0A6A4VLK4_AMPAM|nr:Ankyrin repeat and SOCS box protein 3 [Amphibalanus amphitrite]
MHAGRSDDAGTLRSLLDDGHGVDSYDSQKWFPVHVAAWRGNAACLQLVLDAMSAAADTLDIGVDVATNDGVTALMMAAAVLSVPCVRLLLAAGADPTRQTESGWSAMHAAVCMDMECDIEEMEPLPEYGAEQLEVGEAAPPPPDAAVESLSILDMLLEAGASLSCIDESKLTPLHLAAQNQHSDVVALFCRHGLTPQVVNMVDVAGRTALHTVMGDHPAAAKTSIVTALLERGADLSPVPLRSLLMCAMKHDDAVTFELLLTAVGMETLRRTQQEFLWSAVFAAGLGFIEVLFRHGLTHDRLEFLSWRTDRESCPSVLGPLLVHNYSRRDTLLALRLLDDDECRRAVLAEPDSFVSSAIDHVQEAPPGLVDGRPSLFCARRVWGLLCHLHSQLECDPTDWGRLFSVCGRLQSVVGAVVQAFIVARAFAEVPIEDFVRWTLDEESAADVASLPDGEAARVRARGRLVLELALQASATRVRRPLGAWLGLSDALLQPPPLAVIARASVYRQVRAAVRSRYRTRPPKLSAELGRLAELLPVGLRPLLLQRDADTQRRLAALLDVSHGSAWAGAAAETQPELGGLGAAAADYQRYSALVTAWEN